MTRLPTDQRSRREACERPDLVPLLARLVDVPDGEHPNERQEDLDELTRRGLLTNLEVPE